MKPTSEQLARLTISMYDTCTMAMIWVNNFYVPEAQDFLLTLKFDFSPQTVLTPP